MFIRLHTPCILEARAALAASSGYSQSFSLPCFCSSFRSAETLFSPFKANWEGLTQICVPFTHSPKPSLGARGLSPGPSATSFPGLLAWPHPPAPHPTHPLKFLCSVSFNGASISLLPPTPPRSAPGCQLRCPLPPALPRLQDGSPIPRNLLPYTPASHHPGFTPSPGSDPPP